jgi:hypothetical protein
MTNALKLPKKYSPHLSVFICSLTIYKYKVLFRINDLIPLLIGSGQYPRIWINTTRNIQSRKVEKCIENNKIIHPGFSIIHKVPITVKAEKFTILTISETNSRHITISQIDFRPIGINLYGDERGLNFGGSHFSNLTFSDVDTIFQSNTS